MTFTFPNPSVTPQFTGDNGITYRWDTADKKWQVKGFGSAARKRYPDLVMQLRGYFELNGKGEAVLPDGIIHDSDIMGGPDGADVYVMRPGIWWLDPTQSPNNVRYKPDTITHFLVTGLRWFDVIDGNGNEIYNDAETTFEFSEGDLIHVRSRATEMSAEPSYAESISRDYDNVWRVVKKIPVVDDNNVGYGWGFSDSLWAYEVQKCAPEERYQNGWWNLNDDAFLPARVTPWHGVAPDEAADLHKTDENLQLQIDELEQEIDVIAPRLDGAQYKYVATPAVKPGEMHIQSGSFTAPTDLVFFNDQALDGVTHGWANLGEGDYLEITDTQEKTRTADNYAMYLVTKAPEGTGLKQIEVALVKGSGAPTVDDVLDAKGFQLADGEISDLDSRYELKADHLSKQYSLKIRVKSWQEDTSDELFANSGEARWSSSYFAGHCVEVFKDLYRWFPPDKYEFVPGNILWFEQEVSGGRQWEVKPPHCVVSWCASDMHEFTSTRQKFQGFANFKLSGINGDSCKHDYTYKVIFQCFKRK